MFYNERSIAKLLRGLKNGNWPMVSYYMRRTEVDLNRLCKIRPVWFWMFDPCFDQVASLGKDRRARLMDVFYNLCDQKAIDVNAQDVFGNTALHLLTQIGEDDFAQILVDEGADVNIQNDRRETPFSLAVFKGNYPLAAYFADKRKVQVYPFMIQQFLTFVTQQPGEMQPKETLNFLQTYIRADINTFKDEEGNSYVGQIHQVTEKIVSRQLKGVKNERVKGNC